MIRYEFMDSWMARLLMIKYTCCGEFIIVESNVDTSRKCY